MNLLKVLFLLLIMHSENALAEIFHIYNEYDFLAIASHMESGEHIYELCSDIDLTSLGPWKPFGTTSTPFIGTVLPYHYSISFTPNTVKTYGIISIFGIMDQQKSEITSHLNYIVCKESLESKPNELHPPPMEDVVVASCPYRNL